MRTFVLIIIAVISYLLGSLNGSIIVSRRLFHKDIRRYGSGNAGLTNFHRTFGLAGFVLVFLIGHTFNVGVNLIGTYVHAARLQYLEFYGKFYIEGGRPFQPLDLRAKYYDIVKER